MSFIKSSLRTLKFKALVGSLLTALAFSGCTNGGGGNDTETNEDGSIRPAEQCSLIGLQPRIINGTACKNGDSPVVSLEIILVDGSKSLCTGTLLKRDVVLTAGHCFKNDNNELIEADVLVTGGSTGSGNQRVVAADYAVHPGYDSSIDGAVKNDVALVTLDRSMSLPTASIFASADPKVGDSLAIFGFGSDEDERTGIFKSGSMTIDSITPDNIYAIYTKTSSNTCNGDSGGPVYLRGPRSDGKTITGLVGVVSAGLGEGCPVGQPSSFTNLANPEVLDWIRTNVPGVRID